MFTLNCKGRLLVIDEPVVMGIINMTPDSFYSNSRRSTVDTALQQADNMLALGAAMLDVGGQSTRPGATYVDTDEELSRVIPVVEAIRERFPEAIISVDTFHAVVAARAIAGGASIVNDISGSSFDSGMAGMVGTLGVPYVCMHVKGTFETMHSVPKYSDVAEEVLDHFIRRVDELSAAGITDIIIDPGIGFSKNISHNFELLKKLEIFQILNRPLMLGVSRKSTIYKTLGIGVDDSLNGTTVLHTAGLLKGASILRVHDVKEAVEAIRLTRYLL